MIRIYHPYEKWEDWKDGLYGGPASIEAVLVARCARLLASSRLRGAMLDVLREYPFSAEVNLSNRSRNRRAWLGQAACCFVCGASEDITKEAWRTLTLEQQNEANAIATEVIAVWEGTHCA